jgi:molecular chaperone GrpE
MEQETDAVQDANEEDVSSAESIQEQQKQPEENFKNKYLCTLAELENVRKRMQKENQQTIRFALENVVGEFIPTIDSFEQALKHADRMSDEVKTWAAGFQMFLSQFKEILHNHGIVAFHSEGNNFDPHYHEAVETVETDEYPEGTILEEFSKGYKSRSRVIRPSKVRVAKKTVKEQITPMPEQSIYHDKENK